MSKKSLPKAVMLQVEVRETLRTRLKIESVRQGKTMGALVEEILDAALVKFEEDGHAAS